MIKIRWGLGGLFVLWVIAMALWGAVGLARSARGDPAPSPVLGGRFVRGGPLVIRGGSVAPVACLRADDIVTECEAIESDLRVLVEEPASATAPADAPVAAPAVTSPRWVLALAPPSNPVRGPLTVSLALTSASPASLALIDVAGRRVAEESLGGLGAGRHRITPAWRPAAGVYWLVLRQEGTTVRRRLVKL